MDARSSSTTSIHPSAVTYVHDYWCRIKYYVLRSSRCETSINACSFNTYVRTDERIYWSLVTLRSMPMDLRGTYTIFVSIAVLPYVPTYWMGMSSTYLTEIKGRMDDNILLFSSAFFSRHQKESRYISYSPIPGISFSSPESWRHAHSTLRTERFNFQGMILSFILFFSWHADMLTKWIKMKIISFHPLIYRKIKNQYIHSKISSFRQKKQVRFRQLRHAHETKKKEKEAYPLASLVTAQETRVSLPPVGAAADPSRLGWP